MAKAAINRNYKLSANGILHIGEDDFVAIENPDTGELISLAVLFEDFADKSVTLSINYDEEYGNDTQEEV